MTPRPFSRARGQWGKGAEGAGSGGLGSRENRWTRLQLCAAASTYPTCHRLLQRAWGGHLRGQGGTWSKRGTGPATAPPSPPRRAVPGSLSPRPRLTGRRGRSCRPRIPAPPVGTGVRSGRDAQRADQPRGARAERPATHLRQQQERQRQLQEPADGRCPRKHARRGPAAVWRPRPAQTRPET